VLAGGRSSRMARDKALVVIDGTAMAARVAAALTEGGCDPVVMIGGDQPALAALGLVVVDDRWPGEGPLGGIITALQYFDAPTVVAACDLPWLDPSVVRALRAAAGADVAVATTDRDEPLCACWMPTALPELRRRFGEGERAVHRTLLSLNVCRVPVAAAALRNVNSPADLPPGNHSG
jgi:molybdopterin-guanine dinucleotide biosynthesis protein A